MVRCQDRGDGVNDEEERWCSMMGNCSMGRGRKRERGVAQG